MSLLDKAEFEATMGDPMRPVFEQSEVPAGFWDYFDAIPAVDFQGYAFGQGDIVAAYRDPAGRFDHVLLCSNVRDVFLVVVIDLSVRDVLGHHLLDLPMLYGLR